ncbi:MAG: glycoside hydrolase family 16 protein [Aeromicrobium erythreum]
MTVILGGPTGRLRAAPVLLLVAAVGAAVVLVAPGGWAAADPAPTATASTRAVPASAWSEGPRTALRRLSTSPATVKARSTTRSRTSPSLRSRPVASALAVGSTVQAWGRLRTNQGRRVVGLRLTEYVGGRAVQTRSDAARVGAGRWFRAATSLRVSHPDSQVRLKVFVRGVTRRAAVVASGVTVRVLPVEPTPTPTTPTEPEPSQPSQPTPTEPSPSDPVQPAGTCGTYVPSRAGTPVLDENFDGSSLDPTRWRVRDKTYLNHDAAWITKDNVSVAGGMLSIAGRYIGDSAPAYSAPNGTTVKSRRWTTGYVDTIGRLSQKYGYFEARIRSPHAGERTRGLWPAFWLRGDGVAGEIDVFEGYGTTTADKAKYAPEEHAEWTAWEDTMAGSAKGRAHGRTRLTDPAGWHTYGVRWDPGCLEYFVDGRSVGVTRASFLAGPTFDGPFHVRINLQIGNSYWGWPDPAQTVTSSRLDVDWVRIYR